MTDQYQIFPSNQTPIAEANSGLITTAWLYLLTWLYRKTGGSGSPIAAQDITVGASPFTYDAALNGSVIVRGGTVTQIDIVRADETFNTGVTAGLIPVIAGDSIIVTHGGAPTMTFLPSEFIPSEAS